jgi:hypothetical protein
MKNRILLLICIVAVFQIYERMQTGSAIEAVAVPDARNVAVHTSAEKFRCDGRQHCSQMNSRAEAEYFVRNCPDTKMDGDFDGIPCENDSRF